MDRDRRPLFILLLCAGFLLPIVAAVGPFVRPHPVELLPPSGAAPPVGRAVIPPGERASALERFLRGRGVVLAEVGPWQGPAAMVGPYELHTGPYRFFGDAALVERLRLALAGPGK
jgi:hypothetical protein